MNLILFGFKSCGKTTFGKQLAERLGCPFIDTDDLFCAPLSPREMYLAVGEQRFRALEKQAVQSLKNTKNTIIALGGGAILDPENASLLASIGQLFYLRIDLETLQKRLQEIPPFAQSIEHLYQTRKPLYEAIPAIAIDL